MSLSEIRPTDLTYLIPELPTKTVEVIEAIIRNATSSLIEMLTISKLKESVIREVTRSQLIHPAQKTAIIRAFYSGNLRLLDQPMLPHLRAESLLAPGKITVIDVFDLDDDEKRAVTLYLLLMFDRIKMNSPSNIGLLLLLDEAHRLFPKTAALLKREYIERVVAKVENIVHRGRKRLYGVVLATQSPVDVNPVIAALCNTRITFRLSSAKRWVTEYFGKQYTELVKRLKTGTCMINLIGTGSEIPPIQLSIPNISEKT